ncbi:MAG: hypothetical protein ACP5OX_02090 [Minisyncoccia bacterium]
MAEKQKKEKIKIADIKPPKKKIEKEEILVIDKKKKISKGEGELKINILKEKPKEEIEEKEALPPKETFREEFFYEEPKFEYKKFIPKVPFKKSLIFSIFGVILNCFLFYYLSFIVLSKAEINIITQKTELPFSSKIVFDSNVSSINYEKGIIPANLFVFKESVKEDFVSTGKGKDEKKATGVVTLINNYSTSPQVLVATTRLETPDGKIFRLDSRVVIPGATTQDGKLIPSSVEAKVTADQPGPEYNIPPCDLPNCKFTIVGFKGTPKYEGFYAISKKEMTGGSAGTVPMITAEDKNKAEEVILNKVSEAINRAIQNKLPANLSYIPEGKSGLMITNLKADSEVGDFRKNFTVTAEGEVKIIAFKKENIIDYIQKMLEKEKLETFEFYKDPEFSLRFVKADFKQGTLEVNLEAQQIMRYILKEEEIKKEIEGKNQKEIIEAFKNRKEISQITVKLKPYWLLRVPKNPSKIKISID